MSRRYILGIDQSTSGTKALLFDEVGTLIERSDLPHRQIVHANGWIEHDPEDIIANVLGVAKQVVLQSGIDKNKLVGVGISNQRETIMAWDNETQKPVYNAIVWQCARAETICEQLQAYAKPIQERTGLPLSPYFSAAKLAWVLQNVEGAAEKAKAGKLNAGTMDSWLIYKLTHGASYKTDFSNASRTQLFHLQDLRWDEEIKTWFGLSDICLPKVCDSNACYGKTDFDGFLDQPIPIQGVLGDSHGALFGQGCWQAGMTKGTYGTGSSVMMNIGQTPIFSKKGLVTSLAWGIGGTVSYVLEGNINYSGAVMKWIADDLGLIASSKEAAALAEQANPEDTTYLVPAFSGLGAPYWDGKAKAVLCGMTRSTCRAEIVKAAEESIAYQIADVVHIMCEESQTTLQELRVDGGPTKDLYLMQFQSDLLNIPVQVPDAEELSGIGAAYLAGMALGVYTRDTFATIQRRAYIPRMDTAVREEKYHGWKQAVSQALTK